jgi:Putative metal-binding motif
MHIPDSLVKYILLVCTLVCSLGTASYAQCDPNALEIPGNNNDEDCDGLDDLFLNLPPQVYMIEGKQFHLFFRNTILSKHPQDYIYQVVCPFGGSSTPEKWTFTPGAQHVGIAPLTLKVLDHTGVVLAQASTQLRIGKASQTAAPAPRKLLLLGHSFLDQGYMPYYLYNYTNQQANAPVTFHGKKSSWANPIAYHEGHGGRSWAWFHHNQNSPFQIQRPVNIPAYFDTVMGANQAPDLVLVYMDVNDFLGYSGMPSNMPAVDDTIDYHWDQYAKPIIDSIRLYAPNAKIGICTVPPAAGWQEPFDTLGATIPWLSSRWRWQKIVSRLHVKSIQRFGNREAEGIYLVPVHLNFNDLTDYSNSDPVHPRPGNLLPGQTYGGYNLVSDAVYAWIHNMLSNSNQLFTFYRDSDGDGFGNAIVPVQATAAPQGFVVNATDCNDTNANIYPGALEICGNQTDENCNGTLNEDVTKPVAKCKPDGVEVAISPVGDAVVDANALNDLSTDNCSTVVLSATPAMLNCANIGWEKIILTAADASGNQDTCHINVQVVDHTAPVFACTDQYLNISVDSQASFDVRTAMTYWFDNCKLDSASLTNGIYHFTCADVDSIYAFQIQVSDIHNNISTCSFVLHIQNNADYDSDGSPNCTDYCPYDAGTAIGYTWYLDLDGDNFGVGSAIVSCIPGAQASSNGGDCDDTNPNINPTALEIVNNAFDENCDGVADSMIQTTTLIAPLRVQITPNPAAHTLRIATDRNLAQITCLSADGTQIFMLRTTHTSEAQIDVTQVPAGFYFLQVVCSDGSEVHRRWVKI